MLENTFTGYDMDQILGTLYTWEFYFGRKKTFAKAWPFSIWDALAEIGGIASFLGIIAIFIGMINGSLWTQDLRESVMPEKKQRDRRFWPVFKRACCPTPEDEKDNEEI
mmetsp:Transcript_10607/g.10694  ORF Transcript_10607/g.10694 Transcript_10607/m.10694 type:complete len:109 (-) Transcript_10607:199-525(-)